MITSGDSELLAQLREMDTEEIPEGFKTSKQWMEEWGLGTSQTNHYLSLAVEKGKMEARKFRVQRTTGARQVYHYREIT